MSWTIGYDEALDRDVGHLVTAYCDQPGCSAVINRGLAFTCGGEFMGGDHGCGLHFCPEHLTYGEGDHRLCERCNAGDRRFEIKGDHPDWMRHKLQHPSWAAWRAENPSDVESLEIAMAMLGDEPPAFVPADPIIPRKATPARPHVPVTAEPAKARAEQPPAAPVPEAPVARCGCSLVLYRDPRSGDLLEDISGAREDRTRMMLRFHRPAAVMPVHPEEFSRLSRFRSAYGDLVARRTTPTKGPATLDELRVSVERFMAVVDKIPKTKRPASQPSVRVPTKTLAQLRSRAADVRRLLATIDDCADSSDGEA